MSKADRAIKDLAAKSSGGPDPLQKCRVCGCSHFEPCNPPCSWVKGQDLCSACDEAAKDLMSYFRRALHYRPGSLMREVNSRVGRSASGRMVRVPVSRKDSTMVVR
jgi:hypothetical protein